MSSPAEKFTRLASMEDERKTLIDALKGTTFEEAARALSKPARKPRKTGAPKTPKEGKVTKPKADKAKKPRKPKGTTADT